MFVDVSIKEVTLAEVTLAEVTLPELTLPEVTPAEVTPAEVKGEYSIVHMYDNSQTMAGLNSETIYVMPDYLVTTETSASIGVSAFWAFNLEAALSSPKRNIGMSKLNSTWAQHPVHTAYSDRNLGSASYGML